MKQKKERRGVPASTPETKGSARVRSPVNYIPGWEVSAATKGAEWAVKGGAKFIEWLKSEGPLPVQILDSGVRDGIYVVEIRATNLTVHGVYIDAFDLIAPVKLSLRLRPKRVVASFDDDRAQTAASAQPKSTLIRPGHSLEFTIEFPVPRAQDLRVGKMFKSEKPLGEAKIKYLILNEKSASERDIAFSIRLS